MIKKLIILSLLLLPSSLYAVDIGEIGGGLEINETTSNTVSVNTNSNGSLEQAFCDGYKLNGFWNPRELLPSENKIVVETFSNALWWEIKEKYDLSGLQIALNRWSSPAYSELESLCFQYRGSSEDRYQEIENLYTQVVFFSQYYDPYPDTLREWIIPSFLIFLIETVYTISFYLVWLAFFNIIYLFISYALGDAGKKVENLGRIKLGIMYLLLIFLLNKWIIGGLVTYVGYDSLEFLKLIFNF